MDLHWLFAIPFILIGVLLIVADIDSEKKPIPGMVMTLFALGWGLFVAYGQISDYFLVREILKNQSYLTVIGVVENFDKMPWRGGKHESFEVDGIRFHYSNFEEIEGFHNSCTYGGPICNNGQQVQIDYMIRRERNYILRIGLKTTANTR